MTEAEVASLMATTDSMTAVVAAKEEVKQAVADDLNSMHSSLVNGSYVMTMKVLDTLSFKVHYIPVITFGAPSVMCGGDRLLHKLGLPKSHLQAITMHRDIVPRAFSCKYPSRVAELLKAVNGKFRNHPCLDNQISKCGAAQSVFLNTPHPLEILTDRSAYGSGGTIQRDHDMASYMVSVQSVIRQELTRARKARRELRRRLGGRWLHEAAMAGLV
ncbi:putative phospholipase A1 PLIP1/2/3 [Helianthus annuus]|nr:putative phospholipase A1 PLIP1/2/3 [Helianthus annuus]